MAQVRDFRFLLHQALSRLALSHSKSWGAFLDSLLREFGPYLTLSALLLTLAQGNLSRHGLQVARVFGVLWTALLLFDLIIVVIWAAAWSVWIFSPPTVVFFNGVPVTSALWMSPLVMSALLLPIVLGFALLRSRAP